MGDKGRSNVDYDADLEVGARAPMMACCQHGVKSVRGLYLDPEIEANCVVARRGGEQAKMNYRTAG